jgi:outer membrane cobalamin receptor
MHIIGGSAELSWKLSSGKQPGYFLVSAHWESFCYVNTLNHLGLEPYCLVTLTLNQSVGKHLAVFAVLRNVLNNLYTSFAEYPMPGISATLGIRANFDRP